MSRNILHIDCNAFYASVEQQRRPELRDKPIAVCGSQEERHGIVLTASYPAKRRGVKTGMAIWQARQHCPELIIVPSDMRAYMRISRLARDIYERYTDLIEPFGLDEVWLDVTGSTELFGSAMEIAEEISAAVKFELGSPSASAYQTTRSQLNSAAIIRNRMPSPVLRKTTTERLFIPCLLRIFCTWVPQPAGSCIPSASKRLANWQNVL